jgi:hypothetical protein
MKKYLLVFTFLINLSYADFLDPDGFCVKNVSVREDGKIYFEYSMESMSGMLLSRPYSQTYLDYIIAHSNFTEKSVIINNAVISDCVLNDGNNNNDFLMALSGLVCGSLIASIFLYKVV